jgi:transcriptional regulatory protein RtcR
MNRRNVALGFLGVTLDQQGQGPERWERWRPTIGLCAQEDLAIDRLELILQAGQGGQGGHSRFEKLFEEVKADIAAISPETEVRAHTIDFKDPWDFGEVYEALSDFAQDYSFDPDAEDYLVHMTTGTHVAQICFFLLVETRYIPARLAQTSPPTRRDRDAFGGCTLIDLDLARYDRLAARFEKQREGDLSFLKAGIKTENAHFNALMEEIEKVGLASRAPILLTGPTGAGKSQLARRIYALKKRHRQVEGPLVEVNCATLRGDQAMSALFGHKKGAFTGAVTERPGLLKSAHGGCLFLDEIGELGLDEQAMLLRGIEVGAFLPVGSDREEKSDFILIAGTNRDLRKAVTEGRFREDLLARINLWTFRLPALVERTEDIPANLDFELERLSEHLNRRITFSREARRAYQRWAVQEAIWPGNFRDLAASVERMATLAPGGRITEKTVAQEIEKHASPIRPGLHAPLDQDDAILEESLGKTEAMALDPFDRVQLAYVLSICKRAPSLSAAGRILFSESRKKKRSSNDADRLRKYLSRFGLSWRRLRE